ncbi:UBX domain-containing protein 2B isoform X2 [Nyctibius grandis]|uniref:UBX domain-containing protein 2B isoform X2 n=1 Tax=Nyctibius grandis TaxID=48427 RepID=UPI0035BC8ED3
MADGGAAPAQQEEDVSAAAVGGRRDRQPRSGGRPPSARDLQLALAELYEDEAKRQSLCPDKPTTTKISNTKVSQSLKIDSLRRLRKPERSMSDDKENQRFYSGDSEYRGLQISGDSNNPSKIVAELFKEAKEHGAVPLDEASRASGDFSKAKSFSGGGYRLGDSSQKHSEYIYGENQDVQILLKLWRNGFSLDDGELRSYSDPTNAQFLESIKRGEIPVELQRLVHGGQVNLDMEDHQEQEYVKPRLRFKAFSGEGQKLGSLTPEIVSTPSSPEEEEKSILNAPVLIDDSMPATKIQIRLADGSRLIQRFNQTHSNSLNTDLRGYAVKTGYKGEGRLKQRRRNLAEDDDLSFTVRLLSFLGIPVSFHEIQAFQKKSTELQMINRTQITDQKSPSCTSYLQLSFFGNGLVLSISEELCGRPSEC